MTTNTAPTLPTPRWHTHIYFSAFLLAIVGLCVSVALLSISMGLIGLAILLHNNWRGMGGRLRREPVSLAMLLLYGICLLGILYPAYTGIPTGKGASTASFAQVGGPVSTLGVWLAELKQKLPLLVLALAMVMLPALNAVQYRWLALVYCGTLALIGLGNIGVYMVQKDEIDQLILQSKQFPIVTGMFHIYFGLLVAFAIFWAWHYVCQRQQGSRTRLWRVLFGICLGILFINLHIVAARTGLLAFWGTLVILALRHLIVQRKWLWLILIPLACGALILAALQMPVVSSSLGKRLENTQHDIAAWQKGDDITHWSLSRRLAAWETAWLVGRAHPWAGVGPANLELAMDLQYARMPYRIAPGYQVYTHNQYLEAWLAYGIPGLGALLVLFVVLIWHRPMHFLLLAVIGCSALAMLAEAILERQIGVSFFALMVTLFVKYRPLPAGIAANPEAV